jgi:hypothetical protein
MLMITDVNMTIRTVTAGVPTAFALLKECNAGKDLVTRGWV